MTRTELDSFVQILMNLKHYVPTWYWLMLDLSRGRLNIDDLNFALKLRGNKTGLDTDMLHRVVYFNEHKNDSDVKIYLNTARLLLPLIANKAQFPDRQEFDEIKYYKNIIEFVSYIGDPKLQYDILTRVINRLNDKMGWARFGHTNANNETKLTYSVARALRSVNKYAQNPAEFTKRDPNDKWFDDHMKTIISQVRDTRMDDLQYYMQIADQMQGLDKNRLKFDIASEIMRVGWDQMGEIASRPRHVWNDPNDKLGAAISDIGNRVRHYVACGGAIPEIESLLNNVVCPNFATANVRSRVLNGTFNPNEISLLVAAEQKKLQK